ncbi:MAG: acyl carrier protein [Acidobacteria bacterium RIFCSPLOWO2_12_FULL_59_11]|nr:MAG: acyl carrier protein [Acidobacteria bacterium RIFCSPLOWO2_12_FULL_59_11]
MDNIREEIRQYILSQFLPGERSTNLQDDTPLLTSGIVDSLGMLRMIGFIEQRFGIEVDAHDATVDNFERIQEIAAFIESKRATRK